MITLEEEYRAAYDWAMAGKPARCSWLGEAHQVAYREGYAEGASHRVCAYRNPRAEAMGIYDVEDQGHWPERFTDDR